MRFLHLSDLHLGKRVCEFSMLDDQRYILEHGGKNRGRRCAYRSGWFIDDHGSTLGFDPFHDSLDGGMSEIIRIGFHR